MSILFAWSLEKNQLFYLPTKGLIIVHEYSLCSHLCSLYKKRKKRAEAAGIYDAANKCRFCSQKVNACRAVNTHDPLHNFVIFLSHQTNIKPNVLC